MCLWAGGTLSERLSLAGLCFSWGCGGYLAVPPLSSKPSHCGGGAEQEFLQEHTVVELDALFTVGLNASS